MASSQLDSVEFAAARFGTRLVVVLGHSQCGAVIATLEELQQPRDRRSRSLRAIVGRIRPSVEDCWRPSFEATTTRWCSRRFARTSALPSTRHGSEVLERLIVQDGLAIVGAEYSLGTGVVCLFEGLPDPA
jgi:carbonic anhydrase